MTSAIGGEAVAGAAGACPAVDPARPCAIAHGAPSASLAQVDLAVRAATEAAPA